MNTREKIKGDVVNLKKTKIACLIAVLTLTFAGCGMSNNLAGKEKFVPADNIKIVETEQEDLDGDGKKESIALYGGTNEQGMPTTWTLVIDEYAMVSLDGQEGAYTMADFALRDVDGENGPEVLFYRYNIGSAGGQGLNIYKNVKGELKEIFNAPNSFDMGKDRFQMKYLGNYQVRFKDSKTSLDHVIELDKSRYDGNEEMLEGISTWVDPIAEYRIDDTDGDGVDEIVTVQRVIGVTHVDTIATLQTVYRLRDGRYQASQVILTTDTGELLAEKKV